jgi:hypothetical protein
LDRTQGGPPEDPRELWDSIVTNFMRISDVPVRVEVHDHPPAEVEAGIADAMERLGTEGYTVVRKGDEIWLIEEPGEVMRRQATTDLLLGDPEDQAPQDVN